MSWITDIQIVRTLIPDYRWDQLVNKDSDETPDIIAEEIIEEQQGILESALIQGGYITATTEYTSENIPKDLRYFLKIMSAYHIWLGSEDGPPGHLEKEYDRIMAADGALAMIRSGTYAIIDDDAEDEPTAFTFRSNYTEDNALYGADGLANFPRIGFGRPLKRGLD